MDNADLRALILGAMKTAYEAGHHAAVEGQYHEEWPDDHVDDWMDDEGITDPGYVRVPVRGVDTVIEWQPIETMPFGEYVLVTDGERCACAKYHKLEGGGLRAYIAGTSISEVTMYPETKGRRRWHRDAKWWAPVPNLPATKETSHD